MSDEHWVNNKQAQKDKQRWKSAGGRSAGKGSRPRTDTNSTKYRLGAKLLELKRGTPEYDETLKQWREAQGG